MTIEHIAVWSPDIEALKDFYEKYFEAKAGNKYYNPVKKFTSYFLTFTSGARLEIMNIPEIEAKEQIYKQVGLAHFAVSTGSKEKVDTFTKFLEKEGVVILSQPRTTGDGYYESVVLDPDGNQIEITI
ncbi:MAG: VOC family protein [Flammeovirgaceae bacterium]